MKRPRHSVVIERPSKTGTSGDIREHRLPRPQQVNPDRAVAVRGGSCAAGHAGVKIHRSAPLGHLGETTACGVMYVLVVSTGASDNGRRRYSRSTAKSRSKPRIARS